MIRINLIASRDNRSSGGVGGGVVEFVVIMLMVAAGGAGVLFFWSNMEDRLTTAKAKVIQEQATIKGLAKARKTLKKFKGKQVELKRQLTIINKLLRSKQGPLRVLDQIIVRIPKRVWLTSIVQRKAGRIRIRGKAESNESVAIFLKKLEDSPFFVSVDLQQIVRRSTNSSRDKNGLQRKRTIFSVACKVKYSVSDT